MKSELTGKVKEIGLDYISGKVKATFEFSEKQEALKMYDEFKDCDKLTVKISKYRQKRSLDANAYFWKLCGELAKGLSNDNVKVTKEDVYFEAIKEAGVWVDEAIEPEKVKWRCTAWGLIGTGWISERVDFTPDGNKEIIRFYYGSSRYNTKQMSKLIQNVVQDCEALGIQIKTPDEIADMLSLWESGDNYGR